LLRFSNDIVWGTIIWSPRVQEFQNSGSADCIQELSFEQSQIEIESTDRPCVYYNDTLSVRVNNDSLFTVQPDVEKLLYESPPIGVIAFSKIKSDKRACAVLCKESLKGEIVP